MADPRMEPHPRRIVFDGTINAGHILSIVSVIAAVVIGWTNLDKRVVVLERDSQHQQIRDSGQDLAIREGILEVKQMLRDVQKSVDAVRQQQSQNRN